MTRIRTHSAELDQLRDQIDGIDSSILELLNKRGQFAYRIGLLKSKEGLAVHVPGREKEVLARLKQENRGPFSNQVIERLFNIIFEESKNLQNPLKSSEIE